MEHEREGGEKEETAGDFRAAGRCFFAVLGSSLFRCQTRRAFDDDNFNIPSPTTRCAG